MRAVLAIAIFVLVPALAAGEDIYRSTDDQGNPLFTDEPPSSRAEPVELKPLTTVRPDETPTAIAGPEPESERASADDAAGYQGIEVTYPPADEAVRHNGGMVPFRIALKPEGKSLEEGHRVVILLDGEVRGSGANTQISVSPVHRGSHTVSARVVDSSGSPVVASSPIDFHLLRASALN